MQLSWIILGLLTSPALMGCASGEAGTSSPEHLASTAPPQQAAEVFKASTQSDAEPIPLVPIAQTWHMASSPGRQTELALPRDKSVVLSGSWRERDTLWEDAALFYAADGHELCVLDGGASGPRHIWTHPEDRGALLCSPAWSADGTALYLWMNLDLGLCALDAHTAEIRPLATLDSHVWHYKGMEHFDPQPRFRTTGVLEDAAHRRLFFLLDEESNAEVAFWQRHDGRGGSWLVTVDPEGGPLEPLFTKSAMRETVVSWDLSPKRGRLYALALPLDITAYVPARPRRLEERSLNGSIVRVFAEPDGGAAAIQLSPDQRRLLIERSYRPGFAIPPGDIQEMSREQVRSLVDNDDGGWVVLDLETGECLDGPERGQESRWAPDSDRIVTVDDWAVTVRSLRDRTITPLIEGGAEDWGLGTWIEPVWSPDGRRLAITGRVLDTTLLLDLDRREYFVMHQHVSEKIWAPVPRPFDRAPGAARLGQWVAPEGP